MTDDVEHLFIFLFIICVSSLVRCLLRFGSSFNQFVCFPRNSYVFWVTVLYYMYPLQIVSPIVSCLFIFLSVIHRTEKKLNVVQLTSFLS